MLTKQQIDKAREDVKAMRRRAGGVRYPETESLLDRICDRRQAGREPYAWTSRVGRRGFPITVPRHPKPLAKGTLYKILDDIEAELDEMERLLAEES